MSFPKGINKIIEEYCYYQLPFTRELFEMFKWSFGLITDIINVLAKIQV